MRYLLDSVILIDHFNGIEQATGFLSDHRQQVSLSVITRAEVLTGFDANYLPIARQLLDKFPCISVDRQKADLAAELRRQHRWKLPDAFQAAISLCNKLILVTRNTKDFPPHQHDFVMIPYDLPLPT